MKKTHLLPATSTVALALLALTGCGSKEQSASPQSAPQSASQSAPQSALQSASQSASQAETLKRLPAQAQTQTAVQQDQRKARMDAMRAQNAAKKSR